MKKTLKQLILLGILSVFFALTFNIHTSYADYLGDKEHPISTHSNTTFKFNSIYSSNTTREQIISIILEDLKTGTNAENYITQKTKQDINKPTSSQQWYVFKFKVTYHSCNTSDNVLDLSEVFQYSDNSEMFFDSARTKQLIPIQHATLLNEDYDISSSSLEVNLYPSGQTSYEFGVLLETKESYPALRLENAYINDGYTWLNLDPAYKEPVIKQDSKITTSANTYKKVNKGKAFSLGTKLVGDGKITYSSSNSKVVTVNSDGKVTIKGCGTATITIKASSTNNYNSASKKVTVTITPAKMSAPTVSSPKKKTLKITVKKQTTVTGYQYQYATNKSFKKATSSKSTLTKKNVTKLKSKKTYYVRVRAYKVIKGKTYYGSWSTSKKIKIK